MQYKGKASLSVRESKALIGDDYNRAPSYRVSLYKDTLLSLRMDTLTNDIETKSMTILDWLCSKLR